MAIFYEVLYRHLVNLLQAADVDAKINAEMSFL
jgi:hypothetical protein